LMNSVDGVMKLWDVTVTENENENENLLTA